MFVCIRIKATMSINQWTRSVGTAIVQIALVSISTAAPLTPGDIVVASQSSGDIYKVNPSSGAASLITTDGLLFNPSHVIIDSQGHVFTAERGGSLNNPGVVQVDPTTGMQTMLAPMTTTNRPQALAFDQNGSIVIGNAAKQLVRIDPHTGSQTVLTTLTGISNIQDVDVDEQGRIVVLDFGVVNSGGGKIIRFDPQSGSQTTVSLGGNLFNPSDLIIRPTGDFIVANALSNNLSQILRVDATNGSQSIVSTISSQGFIALQDENTIDYADFFRNLSVQRIDLTTGHADQVSSFVFPHNVVGVGIFVPEPTTLSLSLVGSFGILIASRRRTSANSIDSQNRIGTASSWGNLVATGTMDLARGGNKIRILVTAERL